MTFPPRGSLQGKSHAAKVKVVEIDLLMLSGFGLKVRNLAGFCKARVLALEVGDNGYTCLRLARYWFSRRDVYARGRYTTQDLQDIAGFTLKHLRLVEAAKRSYDEAREYLLNNMASQRDTVLVNCMIRAYERDEREHFG